MMPKQKSNQNGKNVLIAVGIALNVLEDFSAGLLQHKLVEQIRKTPGCPYLTPAEGDEVLIQLEEIAGVVKDGNKWRINTKVYKRPATYPDREGNMPVGALLETIIPVPVPPKKVPAPPAKKESADHGWDTIKRVAKPIFDAVLTDNGAEGVAKSQLIAFANKGYKDLSGLGFDITEGDFVKVLYISVGRANPERSDWYVGIKAWNATHPKESGKSKKIASNGRITIDLTACELPITIQTDGTIELVSPEAVSLNLVIREQVIVGMWTKLRISFGNGRPTDSERVRTEFDINGLRLCLYGVFDVSLITPVGTIEATFYQITLIRE